MDLLTKKLKVTWKKPLHVNDTVSLVLYRYEYDGVVDPTCENMPTIGELVMETKVIDEGFFDDEVEAGTWHYAIYAKNKAGLSPCAIDTYEVLFDADGDGVIDALDKYPYNPLRASGIDSDGDGIDDEFDPVNGAIRIDSVTVDGFDVTFTVVAIGSDINAWRYSINDGALKAGNAGTITETMPDEGQYTIKVEALDEDGEPMLEDTQSFDIETPSVITIDSLSINVAGNPVITITAEGTNSVYWGYKVRTQAGQIVATGNNINLQDDATRSAEETSLNEGEKYDFEAYVLSATSSILATDTSSIAIPVNGADYVWGIDIAAGEFGVPEPDESILDQNQGSFTIRSWASDTTVASSIVSQSTVTGGFLGSAILTETPLIRGYYLNSAIFSQMVPEKWYHMVANSITNPADGSKVIRLYINSIFAAQTVIPENQNSVDNLELLIGAVANSSWRLDHAFNGKVDQVCFWDRGLSSNDIQELYNYGDGKAFSNMTSDLKQSMEVCLEFDQASTFTSSSHSGSTSRTHADAFGYSVDKASNTDFSIQTVGADFADHPITRPGGKVSAHAFTPCYLPGLRNGINPDTGVQYTSAELADFYNRDTRKVTVLNVNSAGDSDRRIPLNHKEYAVSCWLKREGRGVGYYSSSAGIKGSSTSYIIGEYAGWSGTKRAKFLMYVGSPAYELDSANYWMYGK